MKNTLILIVLLLSSTAAIAQYNDSTHYYAGLTAIGTANTTATSKSYVLSNGLKLGVRRKDVSLNFTNSWLFGEQDKKLTNNDFSSVLDFNLYKTFPHFYYWGLATYTTSYSLKINSQYQGGVGVAYNILDKKNAYLNISDGVLYENSDIYLRDTVRDIYSTYRNSLRLSFRFLIWNVVTVSNTNFLQSSFAMKSDYIIKSNTSLSVKILKWCSLTTSFTYNRVNRTQKENAIFNYGLTLEKYF